MSEFVDRNEELQHLRKLYDELTAGQLVFLYGRRRVGKTELIKYFLEGVHLPLYLYIDQATPGQLLKFISNDVRKQLSDYVSFETWDEVLDFIGKKSSEERLVVVFDEFQRIAAMDQMWITRLQKMWDEGLKDKKLMLVLMGSSIGMMRKIGLGINSPLYARITARKSIEPFDFFNARRIFRVGTEPFENNPFKESVKLVEFYSVFGGTPYYLQLAAERKHESLKKILVDLILSKDGLLREEPLTLIQSEVNEVSRYNSILTTIASGKQTLKEISDETKIEITNLGYYLETLDKLLYLIEVKKPVLGNERSAHYKLKDNFFKFWYRFVFKNLSDLELNKIDEVVHTIEEDFACYVGPIFEDIVIQYLKSKRGSQLKAHWFDFSEIGGWWDRKGNEIDVCAYSKEDNWALFGEVKWSNKQIDMSLILGLEEKIKLVDFKGKIQLAFFSKSGIEEKAEKYCLEKGYWVFSLAELMA